jgi:hypothetical protein
MLDERVRDAIHSNGDDVKLAAVLAEFNVRLNGIEKNTATMAVHQEAANHRTEKLEIENVRQEAKREEREKWEKKTAANLRWVFVTGLAAAGVLSGIVFGVLDRISP